MDFLYAVGVKLPQMQQTTSGLLEYFLFIEDI